MEQKDSIARNYIYNFIKTLSTLAFPVVTFAYTSRILGVEGIGKFNFSKSYMLYFTMLAALGMNYYGTREAAKCRDDKGKLTKFVKEMLCINAASTLASYGLLILTMLFVPHLEKYRTLIFIISFSVLLEGLGMEWLYQALEQYRYITVRSMAFQLISLPLMFLLVKNKNDLNVYMLIYLFATSGMYIFNFVHAGNYLDWKNKEKLEIIKHIKPLLLLFAMAVSIKLYTVLDTTMLSFLKNDYAVGKYTAAVKINKIVNGVITSLGVVLIPRLSYYIGNKRMKEVNVLVKKAYNYVFLLSVPAAIGLYMLSREIIILFSGSNFLSAAHTTRLLVPIVIIIPFSVVTNTQTFVPMSKEKAILVSTFAGAVTNMTANLLLIPKYAENGAAVATVLAESVVAVICFINVKKYFDMRKIFAFYYQYILAAIPIVFISGALQSLEIPMLWTVTGSVVLSVICYVSILKAFRNPYITEMLYMIQQKIRKMVKDEK